jgi:hypothetical protein
MRKGYGELWQGVIALHNPVLNHNPKRKTPPTFFTLIP